MRVCDICHGGNGGIASLRIADAPTTVQNVEWDDWDCCGDCRKLLMAKDWIGLASRSGAGLVEENVKKGVQWVTDQVVPEIKKRFMQESQQSNTSPGPQA